jgi:hypothetical protein
MDSNSEHAYTGKMLQCFTISQIPDGKDSNLNMRIQSHSYQDSRFLNVHLAAGDAVLDQAGTGEQHRDGGRTEGEGYASQRIVAPYAPGLLPNVALQPQPYTPCRCLVPHVVPSLFNYLTLIKPLHLIASLLLWVHCLCFYSLAPGGGWGLGGG